MIYHCPRCGQKNRLPETLEAGGVYRCGQCQETLDTGPKSRKAVPKTLLLLNALYVLAILTLTLSNALGPERWWLGSLNLYLPQWLWAVPGAALLLLTAWGRWRRLLWLPAAALVWVLGPVMGFSGNGLFHAADPSGPHVRVMTYNVKGGIRDSHAIAEDISNFHPDLIQMQDSEGVLGGEVGLALKGWNVRASGQYIVASPHPLPELESRDISFEGSNHHCVRYTLQIGVRTVTVYDVHLLSPRGGLMSVRHHQVGGMDDNVDARLREASRLAGYVSQEHGPVLLTGDLNAPVQSLVCRSLFDAGLRDAFSAAGVGYGYTYGRYTRVGQSYVRIDHILVSSQWQVTHCVAGNTSGSDHCPVIADLVLAQ